MVLRPPNDAPPAPTIAKATVGRLDTEARQPVVQFESAAESSVPSPLNVQSGRARKGLMEAKQDTRQRQNQRFTVAARQFQKTAKSTVKTDAVQSGPDAARRKAAASYRGRKLKSALAQYRSLLRKHPGYRHRAAVLVETARVEMAVGDLKSARRHLLEVVRGKNKSHAKRAKALLATIEKRLKAKSSTKPTRIQKSKAVKDVRSAPKKSQKSKPSLQKKKAKQDTKTFV